MIPFYQISAMRSIAKLKKMKKNFCPKNGAEEYVLEVAAD